jgi:hypothetical protein
MQVNATLVGWIKFPPHPSYNFAGMTPEKVKFYDISNSWTTLPKGGKTEVTSQKVVVLSLP